MTQYQNKFKKRKQKSILPYIAGAFMAYQSLVYPVEFANDSAYLNKLKQEQTEKTLRFPKRDLSDRVVGENKIIDSKFVNAIISIESNWNPLLVSHKGAIGLMQLMPETLMEWNKYHPKEKYNLENLFNPKINKKIGTWYLNHLNNYFERTHENWGSLEDNIKKYLIAAGNNGGPNRLIEREFSPMEMPKETRQYLLKLKSKLKLKENIYF